MTVLRFTVHARAFTTALMINSTLSHVHSVMHLASSSQACGVQWTNKRRPPAQPSLTWHAMQVALS